MIDKQNIRNVVRRLVNVGAIQFKDMEDQWVEYFRNVKKEKVETEKEWYLRFGPNGQWQVYYEGR